MEQTDKKLDEERKQEKRNAFIQKKQKQCNKYIDYEVTN